VCARAGLQEWNRYQSRRLVSFPLAPTPCYGSVEVSECRGTYISRGTTWQYTHQVCRLQPGVPPEKPAVCFTTEIAQFDVKLCRWCLDSTLPPGYGHGRTPQSLAQFRLAQVKTAAQRGDPKSPLGSCVVNAFHVYCRCREIIRLRLSTVLGEITATARCHES